MAGPFGFFKGLGARVLYSMPATAICWSTYEFFKYMLSQKKHEDYRSSVSGNNTISNSIVDVKTEKKQRTSMSDDTVKQQKRYVIPKTTVITPDIIADGTTLHHSSSETNTPASTLLPAPRELTSISGAGVYSTLSLSSMHTERMYDPNGRGCNR